MAYWYNSTSAASASDDGSAVVDVDDDESALWLLRIAESARLARTSVEVLCGVFRAAIMVFLPLNYDEDTVYGGWAMNLSQPSTHSFFVPRLFPKRSLIRSSYTSP